MGQPRLRSHPGRCSESGVRTLLEGARAIQAEARGRLLHAQTDRRVDGSSVLPCAGSTERRQVGQGPRSGGRRGYFLADSISRAGRRALAGRWQAPGHRCAQANPLQSSRRLRHQRGCVAVHRPRAVSAFHRARPGPAASGQAGVRPSPPAGATSSQGRGRRRTQGARQPGTACGRRAQGAIRSRDRDPPWASGTKLPEWNCVLEKIAQIAADRGIANKAPPLPNEVLDLPFLWRSLEWAKPDGQIAFALHARLLFAQGDGMPIARQAVFEALDVTSVVNGAELRQTKVWPHVLAPFCILFGTNRKPGAGTGFRIISPRIEDSLNKAGSMRIDTSNAEVVATRQLVETPEILKVLFRGSKADLGVLERIREEGHPTLYDYWKEKFGLGANGRLRGSGNGYQALRPTSRVRRHGDGLPGVDAGYLRGRPHITTAPFTRVLIDSSSLDLFSHERIHDPRSIDLFCGPQTIFHESPSKSTARIGVAVSDEGVVYNTSFHGYCPGAHPDAALFVRYLALVLGSKLAIWFALVTSGRFGVEKRCRRKDRSRSSSVTSL